MPGALALEGGRETSLRGPGNGSVTSRVTLVRTWLPLAPGEWEVLNHQEYLLTSTRLQILHVCYGNLVPRQDTRFVKHTSVHVSHPPGALLGGLAVCVVVELGGPSKTARQKAVFSLHRLS